jgi:hypothetical protein
MLRTACCLMASADHPHDDMNELGRTRRIFLNGILHYWKQFQSGTNTLTTIWMPSPPLKLIPQHSQQDTGGSLKPDTATRRQTFSKSDTAK